MSVKKLILVGVFVIWLPIYGEPNAFHGKTSRLKQRSRVDNVRGPIVHRNNYSIRSDGRRYMGKPPSVDDPGYVHNRTKEEKARDRNRLTYPTTTTTTRTTTKFRGTPYNLYECDYVLFFCMKAYNTSYVCGRSIFFVYYTFDNYCNVDFVNCKDGFKVWHVVHMGKCFKTYISEHAGGYYRYHANFLNYTYAEGEGDRIEA